MDFFLLISFDSQTMSRFHEWRLIWSLDTVSDRSPVISKRFLLSHLVKFEIVSFHSDCHFQVWNSLFISIQCSIIHYMQCIMYTLLLFTPQLRIFYNHLNGSHYTFFTKIRFVIIPTRRAHALFTLSSFYVALYRSLLLYHIKSYKYFRKDASIFHIWLFL